MAQQKNSRKGSAVWPMVLSWLSSLILALLAVFVMLFTTFGNVGYMQSCVKSSGYAQSAYDDMVQDFISYGAATGFATTMQHLHICLTAILFPIYSNAI